MLLIPESSFVVWMLASNWHTASWCVMCMIVPNSLILIAEAQSAGADDTLANLVHFKLKDPKYLADADREVPLTHLAAHQTLIRKPCLCRTPALTQLLILFRRSSI